MLSPIATDSTVATFGFRNDISGDLDKDFRKTPKHVRQYSNWYGYGDPVVIEGDSMYRHADIYFNHLGLITKIESDDELQRFYYDKLGNLVLRDLHTKDETSYVDRMSYDAHGNLLWYFQYKVMNDSTYVFSQYKEYSYKKEENNTIVTIKGLEKWSDFHKSSTLKTFDESERIQTVTDESYGVLNARKMHTYRNYTYQTIQGKSYILYDKFSLASDASQYVLDTYKRDASGRLIMHSDRNTKAIGYTEYRDEISYPENNKKIVTTIFSATIPKHQRRYLSDVKEGIQNVREIMVDSYGNCIKLIETTYDDDDKTDLIKTYQYVYDAHFNWTRKTCKMEVKYDPAPVYEDDEYDTYDPENDIEKYYREISYFSSPEPLANPPKFDPKAEALKDQILLTHFKE